MRDRLLDALRPGRSYWALIGIVLFFFLPELIAALWGEEIRQYFLLLASNETDIRLKKIYELFEDFGEVSYLNLALGVLFTFWFFYERANEPPKD